MRPLLAALVAVLTSGCVYVIHEIREVPATASAAISSDGWGNLANLQAAPYSTEREWPSACETRIHEHVWKMLPVPCPVPNGRYDCGVLHYGLVCAVCGVRKPNAEKPTP